MRKWKEEKKSYPLYVYRVIQNKAPPPLPGQNEKCSLKTEDSIFKYNLFNNYLELFGSSALTQDPFVEEIKKSQFSQFLPKNGP